MLETQDGVRHRQYASGATPPERHRDSMFDHLLLAIDGSPGSDLATDLTAALAKRCEASVHVLHVNEYLVGGRGVTLRTADEATELITATVGILAAAGVRATGSTFPASYREVAAH